MTKVVFDISLSVDGFMTADEITPEEPLGQDGQRLHAWATEDEIERAPNPVSTVGALIAGRRTYETSLPWWGTGGPHPPVPVFVVTHGDGGASACGQRLHTGHRRDRGRT